MVSYGGSRKRQLESGESEPKPKRKRATGGETLVYLQEKSEKEFELRKAELEIKKKEVENNREVEMTLQKQQQQQFMDFQKTIMEHAKYDELNDKAINMEAGMKKLKDENSILKRDLANTKGENDLLKIAQDELEQYGRRECVEIRGIPLVPDENTNEIVIKLASKLGIDITKTDISISHRLGTPAAGSTRSGRSFINPKTKSTQGLQSKIVENNIEITDTKTIAETFNKYFSSIGSRIVDSISSNDISPLEYMDFSIPTSFFLSPVTANEIQLEIAKLNISKTSGPFSIPTKLLKNLYCNISEPLEILYN
ncbi:Hypothetical predicted protein [Paramuricea clavata]|uniref:Uncharacterized protein n=1 Tax=Paramuricea clavata TaxID=317549 RepID=A0A6S7GQG1_PARCT|nr:Hypothetical predicted protein [Paramuricea clavata]